VPEVTPQEKNVLPKPPAWVTTGGRVFVFPENVENGGASEDSQGISGEREELSPVFYQVDSP